MSKYATIRQFIVDQLAVIIENHRKELDNNCPQVLSHTWMLLKAAQGTYVSDEQKFTNSDPLSPVQFLATLNNCLKNYNDSKGIFTWSDPQLIIDLTSLQETLQKHPANEYGLPLAELFLEMTLEDLINKATQELTTARNYLEQAKKADKEEVASLVQAVLEAVKKVGELTYLVKNVTTKAVSQKGRSVIHALASRFTDIEGEISKIAEETKTIRADKNLEADVLVAVEQAEQGMNKARNAWEARNKDTDIEKLTMNIKEISIRVGHCAEQAKQDSDKIVEPEIKREAQKAASHAKLADAVVKNLVELLDKQLVPASELITLKTSFQAVSNWLLLALEDPQAFAAKRDEIAEKLGISSGGQSSKPGSNPGSFFAGKKEQSLAAINEALKKIHFAKYITRHADPAGKDHVEDFYKQRALAIQALVLVTYNSNIYGEEKTYSTYDKKIAKMICYYLLRLKYSHTIQMVIDMAREQLQAVDLVMPKTVLTLLKTYAEQDEQKERSYQALSKNEAIVFSKLYESGHSVDIVIMKEDSCAAKDIHNLAEHIAKGRPYQAINYFEQVKESLRDCLIEQINDKQLVVPKI